MQVDFYNFLCILFSVIIHSSILTVRPLIYTVQVLYRFTVSTVTVFTRPLTTTGHIYVHLSAPTRWGFDMNLQRVDDGPHKKSGLGEINFDIESGLTLSGLTIISRPRAPRPLLPRDNLG